MKPSVLAFSFKDCALKERLSERLCSVYGRWLGGFRTRELRDGAARLGFEVEALGGGRALLASKTLVSPVAFNKYGVDLAALDVTALRALETAAAAGRALLFDELGPLALLSPGFSARAVELLFSGRPCVVFFRRGARQFEEAFLKKDDTVIIELAAENWAEAVAAAQAFLDKAVAAMENPE
ncbi:MAG: hypothetical protein NDI60_07805 [Elusimicrobiales bacterium]|nr:hypothetical protein [Elusimicrobiales bacterium]